MPRCEKKTRAKGWIRKNTRIGLVLDIKVCHHEDRYSIEIMVESLCFETEQPLGFESWAELTSTWRNRWRPRRRKSIQLRRELLPKQDHDRSPQWRCIVSIPLHERKWIDNTPEEYDHDCFTVSKAMIRQLRHGKSVHREEDGAVRFDDILEEFKKKKVDGASQRPLNDWISFLAKGRGAKKRFQYWLNPNSSNHFLHLGASQGHSGGNAMDPELQDSALLPEGFTEYVYHVGNASEMNSIIRSGLIPGGRSLKRGRQAVFFTTLNAMEDESGMVESPRDLTKPRIAPQKNTWKRLQIQYVGAIRRSLKRKSCIFPKHSHMQSISTLHCLQLASFCVSSSWITIRRTSSRLFRCVVFVCINMYIPSSHCILWGAALSYDRLGLPMEALLDPSRRLIQEGLFGRMGLHLRCTLWRTQLRRSGWSHPRDFWGVEACFFVTLGASEAPG